MKGKSVFLSLVLALLTLLAVVGIWTQIVPKYQAKGEVRIEPFKPYLVFKTENNGAIPHYDSFVNTQLSVMKSPSVLSRVLDRADVKNTQWFSNPPKTFRYRPFADQIDPPLERLKETLSIRSRPNTEIIDVSFVDAVAKDAAVIVNAVLDQYLTYIGEASDKASEELYRKLVEQYQSLETEIEVRQETLTGLLISLGTVEPRELIETRRKRLDQKQAHLKDLQNRIKLMEKALEQADPVDSNGLKFAPDSRLGQPDYYMDPAWRELNEDLRSARHRLLTSQLGPNHPDYRRVEKEFELAKESLRNREDQLDRKLCDHAENEMSLYMPSDTVYDFQEGATSVEDRLVLAKEDEQQLSEEIEKERRKFQNLFDKALLLKTQKAKLREKRELFDAVRRRKEQKDMERNVPDSMNISILSRAAVPSEPHKDRRILYAAVVLGLYLAVGSCIAIVGRKRETSK